MKNNKLVCYYFYGSGTVNKLQDVMAERPGFHVVFIDHFFKDKKFIDKFNFQDQQRIFFINTTDEVTTDDVDEYIHKIRSITSKIPTVIVGIGGGTTLDVAKAVANLLTNSGKAEDYQGWDLIKNPGIYKIGIPTLWARAYINDERSTVVLINILFQARIRA